jgi:hypothetical protein
LGNTPVKIDWLNIDVRDGEITAAESFKIREEIPSIPDALLGLKPYLLGPKSADTGRAHEHTGFWYIYGVLMII